MANRTPDPLVESSFFTAFRDEGFPAIYPELKTAAHVDVLEAGIILAFVILGVSLVLVLPGTKRGFQQWSLAIRIFVCVTIGAILTVTNFGQEWEVGHVDTKTPYKPLVADEIHATIHLHVGLRSINVTMKADKHEKLPESLKNEIIDYNEQFSWTWDQGRFGFGPYAGRIQREFREAQRKGLPLPILWIVDYFVFDGEGYRFGRFYRTAGWYTHIAMWTALPTWIMSCILLHCAVGYGAVLTCLTGLLQLLACFIWSTVRNPHALFIPFEDQTLTTKYGRDFWLIFCNGLVCTILGLILVILHNVKTDEISTYFGIDPLTSYDEKHLTDAEFKQLQHPGDAAKFNAASEQVELGTIDEEPIMRQHDVHLAFPDTHFVLKRKATLLNSQRVRAPKLPPRTRNRIEESHEIIYDNVPIVRGPHGSSYTNPNYAQQGHY